MSRLGIAVSDAIEKTGTSSNQLAESLGICRSSLFNKLRGRTPLTLSEGMRLSRLIGCTMEDVWEMQEEARKEYAHAAGNG